MGDIFCSDIVSRQSTEMSLDGTSPEIGEKTALGDWTSMKETVLTFDQGSEICNRE